MLENRVHLLREEERRTLLKVDAMQQRAAVTTQKHEERVNRLTHKNLSIYGPAAASAAVAVTLQPAASPIRLVALQSVVATRRSTEREGVHASRQEYYTQAHSQAEKLRLAAAELRHRRAELHTAHAQRARSVARSVFQAEHEAKARREETARQKAQQARLEYEMRIAAETEAERAARARAAALAAEQEAQLARLRAAQSAHAQVHARLSEAKARAATPISPVALQRALLQSTAAYSSRSP